ncbi:MULTISPECIES: TRAP transporter large permease subunit [Alphaproteobacteria]|uniref:Uncharacterized protein n=2 Tax=Alphaproteobacteria TaxID=28211 RepID=A0A512HNC6_9HYPH|nr:MULTISPECIES: TRAP transporter large permease subunit [Alphaproteobacteria]GEO86943.1 hypothetical protein RNA01_38750 [Ciceribacter naphthalenivorans]GLR23285.1 hypothetical protein GCM10007920_30740 [Ciceribacter naphthalenivorans]GLT06141.1 hypothetical protein GCM10007926_30740 [Sphingomonas psychrolutea]
MIVSISRLAGYVAGSALLLTALIITIDVILRWAIAAPIRGLFELSELAFACIITLAFAFANYRRAHVSMGLFGGMTGRTNGLNFVASILTALVFALFTYVLFDHAASKVEFGERTVVLGLGLGPFWYAAAAMTSLGLIVQVAVTAEDFTALMRDRTALIRELAAPLLTLAVAIAAAALLVFYHAEMSPLTKVLLGFAMLYLLALAHVPIGIAMALSGLAGCYAILGGNAMLLVGGNNLTSALASADLASVPLFLLMGNLAITAGFADDIFAAATSLFARLRGGHAIATVMGCAGFGAISGSSVATTATLGGVAYREMTARNYAPSFATGSIAAGGTLGALIPPSVILIIYCVIAEQSVSEAFMAALIPGLLATLLYVVAILVYVRIRPDVAPLIDDGREVSPVRAILTAWRPILLFLCVIGGLYGGLFNAQEAAAAGTGFAFVFWLVSGRASVAGLLESIRDAVGTSAVLYIIIIGANIFGAYLNFAGVTNAVLSVIEPGVTPAWLILLILVIMYLILGSVFDTVAAIVVTVPFVIPIIVALDYDLIWWGVVTLTLVEIGMITPPVGMNVFVMKSQVGDEVSITTIFKGVVPFLMADGVRLFLLISFPIITLWLPAALR